MERIEKALGYLYVGNADGRHLRCFPLVSRTFYKEADEEYPKWQRGSKKVKHPYWMAQVHLVGDEQKLLKNFQINTTCYGETAIKALENFEITLLELGFIKKIPKGAFKK